MRTKKRKICYPSEVQSSDRYMWYERQLWNSKEITHNSDFHLCPTRVGIACGQIYVRFSIELIRLEAKLTISIFTQIFLELLVGKLSFFLILMRHILDIVSLEESTQSAKVYLVPDLEINLHRSMISLAAISMVAAVLTVHFFDFHYGPNHHGCQRRNTRNRW